MSLVEIGRTEITEGNNVGGAREPRWFAWLFSAGLLIVVLGPIVENGKSDPDDDFPLSYYPMFAKNRNGETTVTSLVGWTADGRSRPLSYKLVGTGGMNQIRRQIRRTVREGRAESLCLDVAERIAERDRDKDRDLVTCQVITGRYRLGDFFHGRREPIELTIEATMAIPREAQANHPREDAPQKEDARS